MKSLFEDDIKKIKIAIIVGSFIALMVYIIWVTVIMGVIPVFGDEGLQWILEQAKPVKYLTNTLSSQVLSPSLALLIQSFIFFAILSSFLGTSLGLYDFLADGLRNSNKQAGKIKLLALTFLPPLIIAASLNRLFIVALGFAGLISTILFGLYPIMLTWSGRYVHKLPTKYRISANRGVFLLIGIFCLTIIGVELLTLQLNFSK